MTRWSLRTRLTVLYGGLFLTAGVVLLAVVYLVVQNRLDGQLETLDDPRIAELRQEAIDAQRGIRDAALDTILTQGGVAVVAVAFAAAATGWFVAGRSLRPLRAITATASRIASSTGIERDLAERIALTGRTDDIKRLADSFDAMLDTLDHAFDSRRRFVANASHELRTPLALERALIEVEITKPTATADQVSFGQALLAINDRHTRLIDGLLFLAESENEIEHPVPVELADLARSVVSTTTDEAAAGGVEVQTRLDPAPVLGDPVLVEQLIRNLVENAVRHNSGAERRMRVVTSTVGGRARLVVSNTGRVIAASETDGLFEPFHRRGPARTAGPRRSVGLGLAVVRAIATTHSGIASARPRPGGGLVVTVDLPAVPQAMTVRGSS